MISHIKEDFFLEKGEPLRLPTTLPIRDSLLTSNLHVTALNGKELPNCSFCCFKAKELVWKMQPKIQEVTLPDDLVETSPHPSLLPPAINPEVHPMVNRLRPVLSTEDAASEVVGTIRHSRREGHSKAIPSVTKILKVVSGSVILECF